MQKWEYAVITESLQFGPETSWWEWGDTGEQVKEGSQQRRLNEMGNQGWELVDVSKTNSDGTTTFISFYFKRRIE